jgi:hypothetical protein
MRRPRWILILCVLLGFGSSLAVPAEDVPETRYDESEGLPYEGTPLFSVTVPQNSVPAPPSTLSPGGPATITMLATIAENGARQFANRRVSLVLLCTLLC